MYTATIQLALNGTEPSWSRDGWSFVPIDLSVAESRNAIQKVGSVSFTPSKNVSLLTPAIRARLECTPYPDLANTSDWLTTLDLSNHSIWNASTRPQDVKTGYQLGTGGQYSADFFVDTNVLGTATYLACCANGTSQPSQGRSAVGYWSKTDPFAAGYDIRWQNKITVKWIYGSLLSGFRYVNSTYNVTLFTEVPAAQALHCRPVIETATADLTVDQRTGQVQSFRITDEPKSALEAWKDLYIGREHRGYGALFQDAMLYASNILLLSGERTNSEIMDDMTFNFRDPNNGLNVDLMTYSMYILAGKDPEALLDASTLQRLANKTFSTFFQHFISSNFSIESGGWAYQRINSSRPFDPVPGQSLPPGNGSTPQTPANVSRTAEIEVHTQVELLEVNADAAWLSVAILAWFILTVIVVAVMEGRHLKRLIRDVECPADVFILISRSERLLQFVQNKTLEDRNFENDEQVMTKLG
ncbi:hypothetical protein SLS56_003655 [Neofusicoccum ribis]|uniref:Uncharacterized protein n=1 Tax=Neofusicoccum ribis TaxID=45134 RepID=A0ABR3SYI9_9PEZI